MITGLMAGVLWGLDTVILGIALAMSQFVSTEQAIFRFSVFFQWILTI